MKSLEEILIEKGVDAVKDVAVSSAGKVFGPMAEELGLYLADKIKYRRQKNFVVFLQEYLDLVRQLGLPQEEPPVKLLHPILENASLEEDDLLRSKWVALLANAADPGSDASLLSGFVEVLKQISPQEAQLLDWLYRGDELPEGQIGAHEVVGVLEVARPNASILLEHLGQVGLVTLGPGWVPGVSADLQYLATQLGLAFVQACRTPSSEGLGLGKQ